MTTADEPTIELPALAATISGERILAWIQAANPYSIRCPNRDCDAAIGEACWNTIRTGYRDDTDPHMARTATVQSDRIEALNACSRGPGSINRLIGE